MFTSATSSIYQSLLSKLIDTFPERFFCNSRCRNNRFFRLYLALLQFQDLHTYRIPGHVHIYLVVPLISTTTAPITSIVIGMVVSAVRMAAAAAAAAFNHHIAKSYK
jgi:hypothetical protein